METLTLETRPSPRVIIKSIDGDLRLVGQSGQTIEAQAPSKGQLSIHQDGDRVELSCRAGCLVFLPMNAIVEAESVAGDLHLTGIKGQSSFGKVGGDIRLRRSGKVDLGRVGGDLSVDMLNGGLHVDTLGGDTDVRGVRGGVHVGQAGGDMHLRQIEGAVEVEAGGDVSARLSPPPDTTSWIRAGGDIMVTLPADASALVRVTAKGDVLLPNPAEGVVVEGPDVICCGSGSASVELVSEGDLSLHLSGRASADNWGADLHEEINARVNSSIAEMEASLDELGLDSLSIDSERIGQRVRRAVARALRGAGGGGWDWSGTTAEEPPGPAGNAEAAAGDEERLAVLQMLEEGKINAEEAEALLRAMEDEG
jgi:SHOCT-like domain